MRSLVAAVAIVGVLNVAPPPVSAAPYSLESTAAYDVRPDDGEIGVSVDLAFTNTTPDPAGQFSTFSAITVAVHDGVTEIAASDSEGDLDATVAVLEGVNTATVELREDVRYEDSAEIQLDYVLTDGSVPDLRIRPSVVVFPAWSFGTASEVSVTVPDGYEVRVDGDALTASGDRLVSGPIDDPSHWLALVTATRPGEYATFDANVPLDGGTADLQVRAFADDEPWGERTLSLLQRALPLLEAQIGLPYPRIGGLVIIEAVTSDAAGFAERSTAGSEILVAFDQPPFTAVHQVAHVWLSPTLIESRWIREGMASEAAARISTELDIETPFDPAAEADDRSEAEFPLDAWSAAETSDAESYAHAAAWALMADLEEAVGPDGLRATLSRVAASIGPYDSRDIGTETPIEGTQPMVPLTSRSFLDQLETVSGVDLVDRFAQRVFTDADRTLLPARREAREEFDALVERADGWGAPDPIRAAMVAWQFDEASSHIADADAWLGDRDALLDEMRASGLSAPGRLQQAYRSFGGALEAQGELDAERAVVREYAATAADVNAPRTLLERLGLIGGQDPAQQLTLANGRFAEGDLRGSAEAISEAKRIVESAEAGGWARAISAGLVVVVLAALAVVLFRRRAAYTAP